MGVMAHDVEPPRAKPSDSMAARSSAASRPSEEGRLISIVVLLKVPRELGERDVAEAAAQIGGHGGLNNDPAPVVSMPPYFRVRLPSGSYVVNDIDEPYLPANDPSIASISDGRLRDAVAGHRAWMSVDWAANKEPNDLRQAYGDIGKLIVALAGPNAVALYSPDLGQFGAYNERVLSSLASDDPLVVFDTSVNDVGVVSIRDDDQKLVVASTQARDQWTRFVDAFEHRRGTQFAVKGRLVEGQLVEHMWLSVTALDRDQVHGTLDNVPTALPSFKRGQDLHIRREDVDDWLYLDAERQPVGGFTLPVLEEAVDRGAQ
ncbi:DUF2314 domain-containing protein [Tahibacter aquaticus]|nr:DUF2314 domain-containing protein [Tahibacter aquaticus]